MNPSEFKHDFFRQVGDLHFFQDLLGGARSQFHRQFPRVFGAAPRVYLLRTRVRAACRLLMETDQPVTAIALDTGFCDHSQFSRTFRRFMGLRPTEYRKRHAPQQLIQ